jgi:hypothetical protein
MRCAPTTNAIKADMATAKMQREKMVGATPYVVMLEDDPNQAVAVFELELLWLLLLPLCDELWLLDFE